MMKAFTAIMALASAAQAHMIMKTPAPALSPNSSPVDPTGSDFPCKIPGGSGTIPDTNKNTMTIGQSNTLSFTGSATHGGGSCQISLAKGNTVSKDTKWMVIHSIEGGCPAGAPGNLPADPNGNGAAQYQFTVPDHPDLGPGTYTLAWTWNNKVGNREFYMNCAYVDLKAASKKRYMPTMPQSKRADAPLPAMFVANIGNGCTVAEGTDVQYPNPGSSVEKGTNTINLQPPQGNCGSSGAQPANPSGSSPSSAAASSSAATKVSAQPFTPSGSAGSKPTGAPTGFATGGNSKPTGAPGQITQSAGGSFATVPAGGNGAQSSAAAAAPTAAASSAAAAQPSAPAAQPTAAAGNGSTPSVPATGSSSGSCTNGYWMCAADGKSFKRCANGVWTVDMQMAAGTSCVPDSSSSGSATLTFAGAVGTHSKRDIRSHIARRAHGFHNSFLS